MTSYVTPKKGVEFIFYISLEATAGGSFVAAPTIASGDFKVSIDGGATANLSTLPTNTPASSGMVKITLSTSEMNGDNITVLCKDAAGDEWLPVTINIQTSARQIDDLAFPNTSGRGIDVSTGGEVGLDWANIGSPTTTVNLSGTTVKTATDVETDTADIQSRLPAALGANGNIKADVRDYNGTAGTFSSGRPEVNTTHAAGTAWNSGAIGAATLATDTITAAKIAADAIGASELAADAVTEIQSGLATAASISALNNLSASQVSTAVWDAATASYGAAGSYGLLVETNLDATVSSRLASASYTAPLDAAGVRSAVGLASANLDTQLDALPTAAENRAEMDSNSTKLAAIVADTNELQTDWVDGGRLDLILDARASQASVDTIDGIVDSILVDTAEIGVAGAGLTALASAANLSTAQTGITAIKAKTDSLTFTKAGEVDANIQSVNDVTVVGTGQTGDEWGS